MAYINKDEKAIIAAALKVAMKEFPTVKYSLAIDNHSSIVCTISKGPECLKPSNGDHSQVNTYWIDTQHSEEAANILNKINTCLHIGHWDESDIQTDYFSCAWYVNINIGKWNKPFIVV